KNMGKCMRFFSNLHRPFPPGTSFCPLGCWQLGAMAPLFQLTCGQVLEKVTCHVANSVLVPIGTIDGKSMIARQAIIAQVLDQSWHGVKTQLRQSSVRRC